MKINVIIIFCLLSLCFNAFAEIGGEGQYITRCNDGTTSTSTGQGSCSWHGGVASVIWVSTPVLNTNLTDYYNYSIYSRGTKHIYTGYHKTTLSNYTGLAQATLPPPESVFKSTYKKIEWSTRENDTFYCIDICDENGNIYPELQAIECGENLKSWSPQDYIENMLLLSSDDLSGFRFTWKVWSNSGYGGEGYQGVVTIP